MEKKRNQGKKRRSKVRGEVVLVFNQKAKFKSENRELVNRFRILNDILFKARNCYELWWAYIKVKSKIEHLQTLLLYKEYIETVGYSSRTSLVVDLYKLYDPQKAVYSVVDLVEDIDRMGLLTKSEKSVISQNMEEAQKIWSKVSKLRHNLFAHRNAELTIPQIYALAEITPNEFRGMTQYTLNILNEIAGKLYEGRKRFNRDVRRDSLKLFRGIKK